MSEVTPTPLTPFDLQVHFEGAFVFSVETESNSSDPDAVLSGVKVYGPTCGHTHAATTYSSDVRNSQNAYMLENYWHCIDVQYASGATAPPITLGQLQQNVGANTPWTPNNRPVMGSWSVAVTLPLPPNDWQCDVFVPTTGSFSGKAAAIIPAEVALTQTLIYKQVQSVQFCGSCFPCDFIPVNGVVDLYILGDPPYVPTKQHERNAIGSMAGLLGLDLLLETSLGPVGSSSPSYSSHVTAKTGNCSMGIISAPGI